MSKSLVLYAEDDADDRFLVEDAFLAHKEYIELKMFEDGMELLQYLNAEQPKPCLIILDLNMPKVNGKDTLRILRTYNEFDNTPVVLFTTSSQQGDASFAKQFNAGFVTKPLDYLQMNVVVDSFLEHCTEEEKEKFKRFRA